MAKHIQGKEQKNCWGYFKGFAYGCFGRKKPVGHNGSIGYEP